MQSFKTWSNIFFFYDCTHMWSPGHTKVKILVFSRGGRAQFREERGPEKGYTWSSNVPVMFYVYVY
jgi:hypothetical protein